MNLILNYRDANEAGVHGHAQNIMRELGITYTHSTPQSLADQYWFWNCENVPTKLPSYLKQLEADPSKWA